jgi:hypothetical protein
VEKFLNITATPMHMRITSFAIIAVLTAALLCAGCDEMISEILKGDAELDKAAQSGDPDNCKKLDTSKDSSRKSDCLGEMARYEKDEKICELIEKGYYKDACIGKAAVAKGDAKVCELVAGSKDPCIKEVAVKLRDRSYCDQLTDKDIQNACFKDIALAHGDPQWCRDIKDAYTRRTCLSEYAIDHADAKYCDETEGLKDSCVTQISVRKGSTADCLKLTTGLGNCVYAVAEDKKDASVCESITSAGTRDKCVHNMAVSTHDIKVCDNIKDASVKSSCIKSTTLNDMQY